VDVELVKGPLHALQNRWRFQPHENGALVSYWIAYEFKNPVLQAAISANKDKLAGRIMAAFEREAKRRLSQSRT
jgi:coenzyme Q-binding protein COQ10